MNDINIYGWIFMSLGWTSIIAFNAFCFSRLLKEPEDKMVSPLEIESEIDRIEEEKEHHQA